VRAIETWSQEPERAQLLMASFVKPHHPFDPPAPWDTMYDPERLTILPGWTEAPPAHDVAFNVGYFPHEKLTERALRRVMAHYYATISQIDHHVGRMIHALETQGVYDRTAIVFTADHGEYLGYHHLLLKGGHMYEPLIRIPLVVKLPGGERAGERSEALASSVDVAPTILRACGVEPDGEMRGLDLTDPAAERDCVFAEVRRGREYMARTKSRKLLLSRETQHTQLLDLDADPHELRNVLAERPEEAEALRRRLADWLLFESPTPVRVDLHAPAVGGPRESHRERLVAFIKEGMAKLAEKVGV
jgi:arylsulfatase A-like enzyme